MTGYRITPEEKESLVGQKMASGSYFRPIEDINGEWFIFQQEHDHCGLGVKAEFVAPPAPEEINN